MDRAAYVLYSDSWPLWGDFFEVKPGLTDAETILEIAKNYSGGGSGSSGRIIDFSEFVPSTTNPNRPQYEIGLTPKDFAGSSIYWPQYHAVRPLRSVSKPSNTNRLALDYRLSTASEAPEDNVRFWYYPETGELELIQSD